jgi:hypothetical protein
MKDSKSAEGNLMGVRFPLPAPRLTCIESIVCEIVKIFVPDFVPRLCLGVPLLGIMTRVVERLIDAPTHKCGRAL